jgi:hypothetical protein
LTRRSAASTSFPGDADPHGIAWLLRLRLATVATGTTKMVVDAALAGYYVQGFSLVRNMLETWRQMVYVTIRPREAARWYAAADGSPAREPSENTITTALRSYPPVKELALVVEAVMKDMNKAAHPSGLAISQTATGKGAHNQLGANFLEPLCMDLFARGTFATYLILQELRQDVPVPEEWTQELEAVDAATGLGRAAYRRAEANGPELKSNAASLV